MRRVPATPQRQAAVTLSLFEQQLEHGPQFTRAAGVSSPAASSSGSTAAARAGRCCSSVTPCTRGVAPWSAPPAAAAALTSAAGPAAAAGAVRFVVVSRGTLAACVGDVAPTTSTPGASWSPASPPAGAAGGGGGGAMRSGSGAGPGVSGPCTPALITTTTPRIWLVVHQARFCLVNSRTPPSRLGGLLGALSLSVLRLSVCAPLSVCAAQQLPPRPN